MSCNAQMSVSDLIAYVEQMPIDNNSSDLPHVVPLRIRRSATTNDAKMIGKTIGIFAPGISDENRKIVENCMLFGELAANQQVSNNQSFAFFEAYYNILSNIGWYTLSSISGTQMSSGSTWSFGREFLNIISSLIRRGVIPSDDGEQLIEDLKNVADALESNSGGFFSQAARGLQRTGFNVALVSQTSDGRLPIITFSAFDLDVKLTSYTAFWVQSRAEAYQIKSARRKMTLNATLYNRIKAVLENKLYGKVEEYVNGFDF